MSLFANHCDETTFLGIPPWYTYLNKAERLDAECQFVGDFFAGGELDLSVFMLAGLGILDILLRLGALVAVGFVVYGGIKYVTSQGEPDKAKGALKTITNALIGLGITVFAVALVSFLGSVVFT